MGSERLQHGGAGFDTRVMGTFVEGGEFAEGLCEGCGYGEWNANGERYGKEAIALKTWRGAGVRRRS